MSTPKEGPVLIDLDGSEAAEPAAAPPVPDLATPAPSGQAMQTMAALAARKPSRLARWFWSALVALVGFVASVAAYDFVMGLLTRNPILGLTALGLLTVVCLLLLAIAIKEMAAFGRLKTLDHIHAKAQDALAANDLGAARSVTTDILKLYQARPETEWGRTRVKERQADLFDADGLLALIETDLLDPLDRAARLEIEAAARQVATVTAVVPIALADLIAALTANLRMIRRIAEIYGGRSGTLGNWRLTRSVLTHLVATGAVAVGDDLIGSIAGGGVLAKVSRRFGEGIVNGALTARVGVAAMEVCRPLPFRAVRRPSVTNLVKRALTGLFGRSETEG